MTSWVYEQHYGEVELLIAIVKDYRKVEEILLGFVEHDVTVATVIASQGMGQILGNVPIFADLRGHFPGSIHDSYIIFSALQSDKIQSCMEVIEQICGELTEPASGIVFTLPINRIIGLKTSIN